MKLCAQFHHQLLLQLFLTLASVKTKSTQYQLRLLQSANMFLWSPLGDVW